MSPSPSAAAATAETTGAPATGSVTLTPYLVVDGGAAAIDFYIRAFGATEKFRLATTDGKLGHAELEIDGAPLMLADEFPDIDVIGPKTRGGATTSLHLDVPDVDAMTARAEAAGARVIKAPSDQFFGERAAKLEDPFGHVWHVTTRTEEVSPEEMQRRWQAMLAGDPTDGA